MNTRTLFTAVGGALTLVGLIPALLLGSGYESTCEQVMQHRDVPRIGSLRAVVLWATGPNPNPNFPTNLPDWHDDIMDATEQNSIPHYLADISFSQHQLSGISRGQTATEPFEASVDPPSWPWDDYPRWYTFVQDVFTAADAIIDFSQYDLTSPTGGGPDGYVDYVFLNYVGYGAGHGSDHIPLDSPDYYITNDISPITGNYVRIHEAYGSFQMLWADYDVGNVYVPPDQDLWASEMAFMIHEYGHNLGLPDMDHSGYTTFNHYSIGDFDPMANYGGFQWRASPYNPWFCADTSYLGWLSYDDVTNPRFDTEVQEITTGSIYQLAADPGWPATPNQRFLVTNHQRYSYWEETWPGRGILIWHINPSGTWYNRGYKRIDMEAAHGLYDWSFTPDTTMGNPNSQTGLDSLDVRGVYPRNHYGSVTCFFTESYNENFDAQSNPSSHFHDRTNSYYAQSVPSHLAVKNIHYVGSVLRADLLVNYWSGNITTNTTWGPGTIAVTGDVTVASGVTLTIEPGTTVIFAANSDDQHGGLNTSKCELIVNGTLTANGTSSQHITFTSAKSTPATGDWKGLYFDSSGNDDQLSYCHILYASNGIECRSSSPTITNCTVRRCQKGLYLTNSSTPWVSNSNFRKNTYGAYIVGCYTGWGGNEHFLSCHFDSNSVYGVYLNNSKPWISGSSFEDNTSSSIGYGVFCYNNSSAKLSENSFQRNKSDGLRATYSSNPELYENPSLTSGGYNLIIGNLRWGVSAAYTSYPNLGTSQTYGGYNSIYNNASYEIYNGNSSGAINAVWNWWGVGHPVPGDFYGSVNYTPYLSSPPTGGFASGQGEPSNLEGAAYLAYVATEQMAAGKYEAALATFREIIERHSYCAEAPYALAQSVFCLELMERAIEVIPSLEEVVAKFSTRALGPYAQLQKMAYWQRTLEFDKALKEIERLEKSGVSDEFRKLALYERAGIYHHGLAKLELAQKAYAEFVNAYPNDELAEEARLELEFLKGGSLPKPEFQPQTEDRQLPKAFALSQNYPNPFNSETEICYQLPQTSHVTLKIYNLLGQEVRTLVDTEEAAGYHTARWDGKDAQGQDLASGIYVYRIEVGPFVASKKLALIR